MDVIIGFLLDFGGLWDPFLSLFINLGTPLPVFHALAPLLLHHRIFWHLISQITPTLFHGPAMKEHFRLTLTLPIAWSRILPLAN